MSKTIYPIWVFVAVAVAIALGAYLASQIHDGAGIIVALGGSLIWTAIVARKGAVQRDRNG